MNTGQTITTLEHLVLDAENAVICGACGIQRGNHSHVDEACPTKADHGPIFHANQFFTPKFPFPDSDLTWEEVR